MQAHRNIVSTKVKTLGSVLKKKRLPANKNHYTWAESLFRQGKIKGPVMHTLKCIIACLVLDRPTIEQLNAARTRSTSRKFAQSNAVDDRTIRRHIRLLELLGYIQVVRSRDCRGNQRNAYTVMAPAEKPEDKMSASLTLATSHNHNNTKSKTYTEKLGKKLDVVFNEQQTAILATLLSWGTWKGLALRWLQEFTAQEIQGGVDYVNNKNPSNKGGYMRTIMDGLDARKRAMKLESGKQGAPTMESESAEARAARARRIEKEAVRRLESKQITDPRTGGVPDYDKCRKYDLLLNDEIRKIYFEMAHSYAKE